MCELFNLGLRGIKRNSFAACHFAQWQRKLAQVFRERLSRQPCQFLMSVELSTYRAWMPCAKLYCNNMKNLVTQILVTTCLNPWLGQSANVGWRHQKNMSFVGSRQKCGDLICRLGTAQKPILGCRTSSSAVTRKIRNRCKL